MHRSTQKIFIITHGPVYEEFYECDSSFDPSLFTIVIVGEGPCQNCPIPFDSIRISSLQGFIPLGKRWAETEAIYGVFCSGIYLAYTYIGFIHYDYKLYDGFCDQLKCNLAISCTNFISFSTFDFLDDYRQKIILDQLRPNLLQANGGPSCYKLLIQHYNLIYGSNLSVWSLAGKRICLCSAYICTTTIFIDMMKLIDFSIAFKALDLYDVENNHRIQGGMAERYVAIYTSQINFLEMELCHEYKYYKKSLKIPAS